MKRNEKRLFFIIICFPLLFVSFNPTPGSLTCTVLNDSLDQYQESFSGGLGPVPGHYIAQSFKPTMSGLTRVELVVYQYVNGGSADMQVSIRDSISGFDLTTCSIPVSQAPESSGRIEFDFSGF